MPPLINSNSNTVSNKAINRLAIPAILTGIAEPLISLVDIAFIGRTGTTQLAAVGIASGFYLMSVWILAQSLTAIAAIISRYYGKNKLSEIASLIPQAIFANIILGVGFFVLTSYFSTDIFQLYNAKGEVLDACNRYFSIRSIGFPFTLATMLLFGIFRGLQNTSWAMIIALGGALINVVLDYILIFGISGSIEPMGLEGAAYASLSAQIFMFLMALIFLLWRTPFNLKLSLKINPQFKWLTSMSWDLFLRTIMLNVTFYLATRYATGYGAEMVAAHTIALNIWLFSSFFIDGYAHAGNAIAGRLLGEENETGLYLLGVRIGKISFWIGTGLALVYIIAYPFMANIFTSDPEVIHAFNTVFWLVILSQPINAIAFALDGFYKGVGHTKFLRNLLAGATVLGFIPVAVGFHYLYPSLLGIWIAFLIWMVIRGGWIVWDFRKRYRV